MSNVALGITYEIWKKHPSYPVGERIDVNYRTYDNMMDASLFLDEHPEIGFYVVKVTREVMK